MSNILLNRRALDQRISSFQARKHSEMPDLRDDVDVLIQDLASEGRPSRF